MPDKEDERFSDAEAKRRFEQALKGAAKTAAAPKPKTGKPPSGKKA